MNVKDYFRIKPFIILFAVLLAGGSTACEEPEQTIRLTSRERIQIDTLAGHQVDSMRLIMDSVCVSIYHGMIQRALDSLLELRRSEEVKLRARIQQEQKQQ
ncbi:MAG TPA: hypothetical protein PLU64_12710 [Saprospiraceae bacterium]|nr:hypothetical protein [Saprospiraceae bacterium]